MSISPFDLPTAKRITAAKQQALQQILTECRSQLDLHSALDAGCGVGYLSAFLRENGFEPVTGFDAREENISEARRRFRDIEFLCLDVENTDLQKLGRFDLVIAMGLLYHLVNPFRALRNLYAVTSKVLFIETVCTPEERPLLYLRDEFRKVSQSLQAVAFYPSEGCVIKMGYRAGFKYVYKFRRLPDHEDYQTAIWRTRARMMFAAANVQLSSKLLQFAPEPSNIPNPLLRRWARIGLRVARKLNVVSQPPRNE